MTTEHPTANDNDDPADVLISDRDLDDLATKILAMEDAFAAWADEALESARRAG